MQESVEIKSSCHRCSLRARAEAKPQSLIARIWRWHTRWCPGWKGYIRELESKGMKAPQV